MKVLFVASEAAPFIKTGGLADVMGALPAQLRQEGVETALVIPKYSAVAKEYGDRMETVYTGTVDLSWRNQYMGVEKMEYEGMPVFFIDNEYYFKRPGLYGYYDDAERFAFFSKAVLAMLPHIGFRPDIIHTNDWHTGLVGVYLKEDFMKDPFYDGIKNVFTIHNMKYQGIYSPDIVEDVLGLPMRLFRNGNIENDGCVNFLKAGMNYADYITTVSPSYAREICYPYFGEGLDSYASLCAGKMKGILNGMDEKVFNPSTDPYIPYPYSDKDIFTRKPLNKEALQKELGLPVTRRVPVFAMITRLVEAKGLDLVTYIMDEMMQEDIQFVVVGTGDRPYEEALQSLDNRYPDKVSVNIRFSEELAHKVYAAADFFLMPSRYEACGISQMIAMKYGAVPVVREVGGLRDSVTNYNKFSGKGNGLVFSNFNAHELLFTVKRAISYFEEETVWEKLVLNAMHTDHSWTRSAIEYKKIYEKVMNGNTAKAAEKKEPEKSPEPAAAAVAVAPEPGKAPQRDAVETRTEAPAPREAAATAPRKTTGKKAAAPKKTTSRRKNAGSTRKRTARSGKKGTEKK